MAKLLSEFGRVIISCEHARNHVPRRFAAYFAGSEAVLETHQAYDLGALTVARCLASAFSVELIAGEVSRLLIDLNRSLHHPRVFSSFVANLPPRERSLVIERYYRPYRCTVEDQVKRIVGSSKPALHISVHSFTPVLAGEVRTAEVGLLYDPKRLGEKRFCRDWKAALQTCPDGWRIRCNYPYAGSADGLTTYLRTRFSARRYVGVELELNQCLLMTPAKARRVAQEILTSLHASRT